MLSICCVTRGEPHAGPFLEAMVDLAARIDGECVIGIDLPPGDTWLDDYLQLVDLPSYVSCVPVRSDGFVESVLDEVLDACHGDYVLRLDDDERCSPAMVRWLLEGAYEAAPHWQFPTANLWRPDRLLTNGPLWPNPHQRCSLRSLASRPAIVHAKSPYGRGTMAPVALEHHKFLVKSLGQRMAIAARYDQLRPGAGTGRQKPYSLPELVYPVLALAPLGDGTVLLDEAGRVQPFTDAAIEWVSVVPEVTA